MMGFLAPIPKDGQDDTLTALRGDLRNSRGRTHLVESMGAGWAADTQQNRPAGDWMRRRWGPEPPESLVTLMESASREVLSACGLSSALFESRAGAASREAWRQALFGVIAPLGRIVQSELQDKLDPGIVLSWDELRASDLSGRARAFQCMVGGGMDSAQAASLAGLMEPEQ